MQFAAFQDLGVDAAFQSFAEPLRTPLLRLRQLILDTGARTTGLGGLVETLKWGEPAYLPVKQRVGTTVRVAALKGSSKHYAMYVHCQTTLVETFARHYPDTFRFEGSRALVFREEEEIPVGPLEHCIGLALTYHRWR